MYHPNSLIFQYITLFLQDESRNFFFLNESEPHFLQNMSWSSTERVLCYPLSHGAFSDQPVNPYWNTCICEPIEYELLIAEFLFVFVLFSLLYSQSFTNPINICVQWPY